MVLRRVTVGVTLHPHQFDLRRTGEGLGSPVEELERARIHDVVIHAEAERRTEDHLIAGQRDIHARHRLGAAVCLHAR